METVVSILDRDAWDANTDIIVAVQPKHRTLTWIPRDLWCPILGDRINRAFALGGNDRLIAELNRLGFHCEHAICLRRAATERALEGVTVTVTVTQPMDFWYPIEPTRPIEEGKKRVSFRPPAERLEGERLHQWIGARFMVDRPSSDFHRIARQKVLLRALLRQGCAFESLLEQPNQVRWSGRGAFQSLQQVRATWRMVTFDRVRPRTINGMKVLEANEGSSPAEIEPGAHAV